MSIDWLSFLKVTGVAIGVTIVAVSMFAFGVRALARAHPRFAAPEDQAADRDSAGYNPLFTLLAGLCFLVVAAMVIAGLYFTVHK